MEENEWNTIYRNLSLRETEDLEEFWLRHDENEWTPIAFDVMEKILIERLGELPPKEPLPEKPEITTTLKQKNDLRKEIKTLVSDNDPVFYDPEKVTLLVKWIFRSMNILIVLYGLQFLYNVIYYFSIRSAFASWIEVFNYLGMGFISALISIIFVFVEYKVLGYVLKILREMEINSRKAV
jgi:hypothetical protein